MHKVLASVPNLRNPQRASLRVRETELGRTSAEASANPAGTLKMDPRSERGQGLGYFPLVHQSLEAGGVWKRM